MQAILDDFHAANSLPELHKVAIGVATPSWLTVVGPPSSLRRLSQWSQTLRDAPQIPADAGVPAHAPFMLPVQASEVIPHTSMLDRPLDWDKATMVSPSGDCAPRKFRTLHELLCDSFEDILLRPLVVDKVIHSCISRISESSTLRVHEVGNTSHMPLVLKTLTAAGLPHDVVPPYQPPPLGSVPTRGKSDLIAVVGMSGRFPGSDNVDELWQELVAGSCHIKKVPKSRYDVDRYFDATQELKNSTAFTDGAWLNDPALFDNRFFNVSPREARSMDPIQRIFLTTAHEALEMAGYAPGASPSMEPDRVASFFGVAGYDWLENSHQEGVDIYYVPGNSKAFITGRLNYHYKFGRGSYTLDSLCAGSTTALVLAFQALNNRDCDMAVVGGGSVNSAPFAVSGLGRSGMLSPHGGCRTFHDDADGYARGEGIGTVVLKRLEDAVHDRDNVLGVISGAARSYSSTSTSITHPSHESQAKLYREVIGQTALDPEEVAFVEMHGTGTQAGDYEELTSVLDVFGGQRLTNNPLVVGAIKAAMGHGEGAAGITSLIKTLMMLKHRTIPSQPGVPFTINHRLPRLEPRNVHIALKNTELRASPKSADGKIKMLVNSFDASGGSSSLAVQEAPDIVRPKFPSSRQVRSHHVVAVSARTGTALQKNCGNLVGYLESHPKTRLCDLAYTTTARRMHSTLRKAIVASSTEDLLRQLRQQSLAKTTKASPSGIVMLFTGQGSQYQSVGKSFYDENLRFRELLDTYQLVASRHDLPHFVGIISGKVDIAKASPVQIQLAIVALEIGVAHLLRTWGMVPDAVIGHSLGEYSALCVSGVLSPSDTLFLVGRRAQLLEQHLQPNTYGMLATPLNSRDQTARIQSEQKVGRLGSCEVACLNAPDATVASGSLSDVQALQEMLTQSGGRSTLLKVPFGFHSKQIDPILAGFERLAGAVEFGTPTIPVASTLLGQFVDKQGSFGPGYLARQAREKVDFVGALHALREHGFGPNSNTLWIEAGPDAICLSMAKKTLDLDASRALPALRPRQTCWETLTHVVSAAFENGYSINWKAYYAESANACTLLSNLPSYAWDYKSFWTTYTTPPAWEIDRALAGADAGGMHSHNTQAALPGFSPTMTLQSLLEETIDATAETVKAIFSTKSSAPGLKQVIEGHIVSGHAIMPLPVFCDMAMTGARHCHSKIADGEALSPIQMTLVDMVVSKGIVLTATLEPVVLTTANRSGKTGSTEITFYEADVQGKPGLQIGSCKVLDRIDANTKDLTSQQRQVNFFVKNRTKQLREQARTGEAHSLLRPVIYRLFGDYVRCGPDSRCIDEAVVSQGSHDATAAVTAPITSDQAASCVMNPVLYDGVNQLAGFLLNNSLRSDDDQSIHITEGFSESRQWLPYVPGRKYISYVSGHDVDDNGTLVDTTSYVFDAEGGQLVQTITALRFQKIKRAVLDHVLGRPQMGPDRGAQFHAVAPPARARHLPPPDADGIDHRSVPSIPLKEHGKDKASRTSAVIDLEDQPSTGEVLAVIAEEAGVEPEDMTDETVFADLGIDSLMAISTLASIKNKLGVALPPSFLMECETVGEAKLALRKHLPQGSEERSPSPESIGSTESPDTATTEPTPTYDSDDMEILGEGTDIKSLAIEPKIPVDPIHSETKPEPEVNRTATPDAATAVSSTAIQVCKMIHLQGPSDQQDSSAAAPTVFLLADETGSSAGYVQLPSLAGLNVFGVDWPVDLDIDQADLVGSLADSMAASIAAHIPSAQLILGGASFGATLAHEVARRLPLSKVLGVLLFDPVSSQADVLRTKDRLSKTRMLRPAQDRRIAAAGRALESYTFQMHAGEAEGSMTVVIPDAEEARNTWSTRIPGADVRLVQGARAGTLLRYPSVQLTGTICQDVVNKIRS